MLWTARAFPQVPGQKLGSAFLPMIVGVGLAGLRLGAGGAQLSRAAPTPTPSKLPLARSEHFGSAAVIVGAVLAYIFLAERVGFLLLAPLCLLAVFRALRVRWRGAACWAIGGTVVVHLAFYKLLRVPLPWGPLTPFY